METFVILLLIVFIIIYITSTNRHQKSQEILERKLDRLLRETEGLRKELLNLSKPEGNTNSGTPFPPKEQPAPKPSFTPKPLPPVEPVFKPKPIEQVRQPSVPPQQPTPPKPLPQPKESWSEAWLRANPDLEKFIGENLVNKIGIAVLVLGIAFFVKYAIDKDWINEVGRVCIGLACGGLLVGLPITCATATARLVRC